MASRARTGYVVSNTTAFVPHPEYAGLYIRTHPCALFAKCPQIGCEAPIGKPCMNIMGKRVTPYLSPYMTGAHTARINAMKDPVSIPTLSVRFYP